jgi:hypothetical protein
MQMEYTCVHVLELQRCFSLSPERCLSVVEAFIRGHREKTRNVREDPGITSK